MHHIFLGINEANWENECLRYVCVQSEAKGPLTQPECYVPWMLTWELKNQTLLKLADNFIIMIIVN